MILGWQSFKNLGAMPKEYFKLLGTTLDKKLHNIVSFLKYVLNIAMLVVQSGKNNAHEKDRP